MEKLKITILISKKDYSKWIEKYGEDYVFQSIENELQMFADCINDDVFEGHKEVFPNLLKSSVI